jgi:hypothetical protein
MITLMVADARVLMSEGEGFAAILALHLLLPPAPTWSTLQQTVAIPL